MAGTGGAAPGGDRVWCRGTAAVLCRRRGPVAGLGHGLAVRSALFRRGGAVAGEPGAAARSRPDRRLYLFRGSGPGPGTEMVGAVVGPVPAAGPRPRAYRARRRGIARMARSRSATRATVNTACVYDAVAAACR